MKNSDFDKYINSLSEEELTPPPELQWEFMDIPIPKKRNKKKFFLLFSILIIGTLLSVLFLMNNETEKESLSIIENKSTLDKIENLKTDKVVITESEIKDVVGTELSTLEIEEKVIKVNTVKSSTITKLYQAIPVNDNDQSNASSIGDDKMKIINTPEMILRNENNNIIENKSEVISKDERKKKEVEQLESILDVYANTSLSRIQLNMLDEIKYSYRNEKVKGLGLLRKKYPMVLSVDYGFNKSKNRYSSSPQASLMNDSESSSYGRSYNVDLGIKINNSIYFNGGLSFHRLHTTFYFEEDLGYVDDFSTFIRTYSTRKVFHNNYSEYLDLNLGIGSKIVIGKRMNMDVYLNLSPGMRLSAKGRILNDDSEIGYIEDNPSKNNLLLSAGTSAKLFYNFDGISVHAGFGYSRGLTKLKLIEDSELSIKPQKLVFSLGLAKQF